DGRSARWPLSRSCCARRTTGPARRRGPSARGLKCPSENRDSSRFWSSILPGRPARSIRARARRGLPRRRTPPPPAPPARRRRSEEHTSELQSLAYLVCRLLLEKKKNTKGLYDF